MGKKSQPVRTDRVVTITVIVTVLAAGLVGCTIAPTSAAVPLANGENAESNSPLTAAAQPKWYRTKRGWERADSWRHNWIQPQAPAGPHPWVVAAFQALLSIAALLAFEQDRQAEGKLTRLAQ